MTCSNPPELDEAQLMAYLEDDAGAEVTAHLEDCPHCMARAEKLNQAQKRLAGGLYRATCFSSITLGEYYFNRLSPDERAAVSDHLAVCPLCAHELNQLREYLHALAPELRPSLVEEAKFFIAQRLGGGVGKDNLGQAVPALEGVRGTSDRSQIYQAGDIQIAVQISADKERPGGKTLFGLLSTEALNGAPVSLWDTDNLIAQSSIPETGDFTFENLADGEYTLILGNPPLEIHLNLLIE